MSLPFRQENQSIGGELAIINFAHWPLPNLVTTFRPTNYVLHLISSLLPFVRIPSICSPPNHYRSMCALFSLTFEQKIYPIVAGLAMIHATHLPMGPAYHVLHLINAKPGWRLQIFVE
jgi:hypothetical protein